MHAYDNPSHLIFDINGNAFISEDQGGNIFRLTENGSSSTWVSGFHSGDDDPWGMTFAPTGFIGSNVSEGDILVTDRGYLGPDEVWAFSPETAEGERLVRTHSGDPNFFDLAGVSASIVMLADANDPDHIYEMSPEGALSPISLSLAVNSPYSIVYDSWEDCLYLSGNGPPAIYRVDPSTGAVDLVADGFSGFYMF